MVVIRRCIDTVVRILAICALLWQTTVFSADEHIGVDAVGMTVSNMDQAVAFYQEVLAFRRVSATEVYGPEYETLTGIFGVRMRMVRMQLGDEILELTEYLTPRGKSVPTDSQSHDHWFQHVAIVVSDMEKAFQRLQEHHVQFVSTEPQRLPDWNTAASGIQAFYFRDPDQHNLEIIQFPKGKGNPKWQAPAKGLFLGIDHTALVVSKTADSLKFYQNTLGFKPYGESINHGTEQAHLNLVQNARLHITSLRGAFGPGIEFLEYLNPRNGRPIPHDQKPNDIAFWQTKIVTSAMDSIVPYGQAPVSMPDGKLGFRRGIILKDPDGHAITLVENPMEP